MQTNRRTLLQSLTVLVAGCLSGIGWAATPKPLSFLATGDWGQEGHHQQGAVAMRMGETAARIDSQFVVAVGDNFYDAGVASVNDPHWKALFEDVYTAKSLQTPWYAIFGNHDYGGVPQAQIDYAADSRRWKMPARYYKLSGAKIGLPGVDLFAIDSSPLVHQYRDKVDAPIAANVKGQDTEAQLAWLDRELGASTARWKLVYGHHTIRSGGSGHGETPELVALVRPLLERHGVQAYINGHDHDMQHISDGGVDYICCGAGSEVRPVRAVKGTKFCVSRSGFGAISVDRHTLSLQFRDYTGATVYSADIARGRVAA